ncbi:MAG: 4Fe-4S binding protein [Deltaproteobacteria bacterium]|nr:4Fe-4S binding protein [Deltaproteobacteria bacterium]
MAKKSSFGRRKISRLRFFVQLFFTLALLYGGFAIAWVSDSDSGIESKVRWVDRKGSSSSPLLLPVTACVYQRQGLCKGCSLYYLTDIVTMLPSLESTWVLLLVLSLLMVLFGRFWCGWACPLGFLSDLFTKLRTFFGIGQVRLSRGWRDGLVYAKYVLLFLSFGIAALAAFPGMAEYKMDLLDPFCQICPARIFSAFFSFNCLCWSSWGNSVTSTFTILGYIAFAIFFIGLTVRRFWCRLCPIGGLTAVFNRSGLVSIVKDGQKCTRCRACARSCPLDIRAVYEGRGKKVVTAYECTLCLRCVEACPEEDCLNFVWLGKTIARS